ncbi:MAG: Fe-Mn family superoxide dismutase [bacterium]|nr:Fe-Mn family superoxide dismutase [bacterium]
MQKDYQPEKLKIDKDLPGFSLKGIKEHFKLYEGYVKKTNEIQKKIEDADKSEANAVYSYIGELKREEVFAINGIKLHEIYFDHLGGDGKPSGELVKMIERDFGSVDKWREDMIATGLSARGWAIMAYDLKDSQLHNYGADAQNIGAVWGAIPIIALDVYEHAYFMDYGTDRKSYVNAFFENLDWSVANAMMTKYVTPWEKTKNQ